MPEGANFPSNQLFHPETKKPAAQESDGSIKRSPSAGLDGVGAPDARIVKNDRLAVASRLATGSWHLAARRADGGALPLRRAGFPGRPYLPAIERLTAGNVLSPHRRSTMQHLYSSLVTHYEKALSFQDRVVEHERRCGHTLPGSETCQKILAENLAEARRSLDRVTHSHH